jgi:plastocyanin
MDTPTLVPTVTFVPTTTLPPTPTPTPTPTLEPVTIVSGIPGFTLESFTIETGTTIKWVQSSAASHTITSGTTDDYYSYPDGKWDSGTLKNGEYFSVVFKEVGVFRYFCNIHPGSMTGVITVVKN